MEQQKQNELILKEWFFEKNIKKIFDISILNAAFYEKETEKAIAISDEYHRILMWIPKSVIVENKIQSDNLGEQLIFSCEDNKIKIVL